MVYNKSDYRTVCVHTLCGRDYLYPPCNEEACSLRRSGVIMLRYIPISRTRTKGFKFRAIRSGRKSKDVRNITDDESDRFLFYFFNYLISLLPRHHHLRSLWMLKWGDINGLSQCHIWMGIFRQHAWALSVKKILLCYICGYIYLYI